MNKVLYLSLTILWCVAGVAVAGEYHVAGKDRAAADQNPGTPDTPFKTVNCAVASARLKPGDTLYVHENGMSGIVVIGVEREGGMVGDEQTTHTPARGNRVWGNILMDNCYPGLAIQGWEGRPELIMPDERITSNAGNLSDYNIFYRSAQRGIPFWWNWGAMNWWTLQEWQDKTGNDKHSIIAEPLFKDAAGHDFHRADKSPAMLFVRPLMSVAMDFDGTRRSDSSLLTAGPYEADP